MDGVIVVDKPAGMTSHDVVAVARKRLGTKKVGHAGTLDPDATGVLVLGVGRATRFLSLAEAASKTYVAVARFGVTTTTQDASGDVVDEVPANLTPADVEAALRDFRGTITQVPPMVSAIKVGGERLYKKARRGEDVARPAREVTIHTLELIGFDEAAQRAILHVECSKGTYIRTLVHDLGQKLGCGAHLVELRRTAVGPFSDQRAVPLDDVRPDTLLPMVALFADMRNVEIDDSERALVANGRQLDDRWNLQPNEAVALVHDGDFVALYKRRDDKLVAERVVGS